MAWYDIYGIPNLIPSRADYTYAPVGALYYAGKVTANETAVGPKTAQLTGVMVQREGEIYTANSGIWNVTAHTWTLDTPWVTRSGQNPQQLAGQVTLPQGDTLQPPPADAKKVSTAELRRTLAGTGLSREERRDYEYNLAARYADPFTPLAFALAAAVLGLMIRNQAAAMAAVIVFIAGFYVVWITMPQLARAGALDPTLAAWVPSLLFVVLGLVLAGRVNR